LGMNSPVSTLTVYDGKLIAGGEFTVAGGVAANFIASWDGSIWSPLGLGLNGPVNTLTVFDSNLIAGGNFFGTDNLAANCIAFWDGSTWSPLGLGMNSPVSTLTVYDGKLIAGGRFTIAGNKVSAYLAAWTKHDPTDVGEQDGTNPPKAFSLVQNYPNPFNPTTSIEYSVPTRAHVTIEIFNLLGQHVRTLVNEMKSAGIYKTVWDGTDGAGNQVSTGVYLYRFRAGDFVETKKMVLLK